jgi:hypothetical protein
LTALLASTSLIWATLSADLPRAGRRRRRPPKRRRRRSVGPGSQQWYGDGHRPATFSGNGFLGGLPCCEIAGAELEYPYAGTPTNVSTALETANVPRHANNDIVRVGLNYRAQ